MPVKVPADTHPLQEFLSETESHISRLRRTKTAEALTIEGQPGLVLQDAESYEALMQELERARFVESLRLAHQNHREGSSIPLDEAESTLKSKHGF